MGIHTFERDTINQVKLHVLPTEKFKTYSITVCIGSPLSEELVTKNALIPFVLRRGTAKYPETQQFREQLEDLYGAGFGFEVTKRGDYQVLQMRMDMIHERFVQESHSLLKEAMSFIGETLTQPLVERNGFRKSYVDTEKRTLKKQLESVINDKIRYAAERCMEEMCEDEPYRLHPLGRLEDIDSINEVSLYENYQQWLNHAIIDIYVVGDTDLNEVKDAVQQSFTFKDRSEIPVYHSQNVNKSISNVKNITEELDVTQGKLNLGLRSGISYADDDFPAALMYNGILGGYPHSKLFINVREKASLAYYAASRFDGHKGFLTIQSGIEFENYSQALEIIQLQLDLLKKGEISDIEMQQTKAMIANQLREIQDSPYDLCAFDFNRIISGKERKLDDFIRDIHAIEKADIQKIAEKVELDTIYFLRNRKEAPVHAN